MHPVIQQILRQSAICKSCQDTWMHFYYETCAFLALLLRSIARKRKTDYACTKFKRHALISNTMH